MPTLGPIYVQSAVPDPNGAGGEFTDIPNAFGGTGGNHATITPPVNGVDWGNIFRFSAALMNGLPAGATINSVTVEVRHSVSVGSSCTIRFRLYKADGTVVGGGAAGLILLANPTNTLDQNYTIPFTVNPTAADMKNANFGLGIVMRKTTTAARTYSLDWVRITVDYTEANIRLDISTELRYHVRERVSTSSDLRFNVQQKVSSSSDLRWNTRQRVAASSELRWDQRKRISPSSDLRWDVRQRTSLSSDLRWDIRQRIAGQSEFLWNARKRLVPASTFVWNIEGQNLRLNVPLSLEWDIREKVLSATDFRWAIRAPLSVSTDLRFDVRQKLEGGTDLRWNILEALGFPVELRWDVLRRVEAGVSFEWAIFQSLRPPLTLRWNIEGQYVPPDNDFLFPVSRENLIFEAEPQRVTFDVETGDNVFAVPREQREF